MFGVKKKTVHVLQEDLDLLPVGDASIPGTEIRDKIGLTTVVGRLLQDEGGLLTEIAITRATALRRMTAEVEAIAAVRDEADLVRKAER